MCWKKIVEWFKPDPTVPDPVPVDTNKKALLFAINNYPGSGNDLRGCLNDQRDMENMLNDKFPGFYIRKFADAEVTRSRFINEVTKAISELVAGDILLIHYSGHGTQTADAHGDEEDGYDEAIYLYDGTVIDDDIGYSLRNIPDGATVVLMFDSCFSGTVTRAFGNQNPHPTKNRYIQNPYMQKRSWKRRRFSKDEMKWIVISGCGEQQTSADAWINGEYHGAFTYYAIKALTHGITYAQWIGVINNYLPSNEYDQVPGIEGRESLFNNIVFQ